MGPASPWLDQSPRAPRGSLSKPPGLTLRLQKGEDISLPDWALHVTHDETVLVVEELDADLGDLSTGSGPSHDLDNNSELQRRLLRVRCQPKKKEKKEHESLRQRAGSSEKKVAQGAQSEAARGKQVRRPQRRSASRIARARCRHGTVWSFPSLCPTPDPQDLGGLEDGERKNRWVPRQPLEAIAPRSAASSAILASHYGHLTPPSGGTGFLTMVTVGFARPALVLCTACLRFGFGPSLSLFFLGERGGRRRCRNRVLETRRKIARTSHFNGSRMDSSLRNVQRKCLRRGGGGGGGEAGEHRSKIAPFRRTHCCEARRPPTGRDHFYDNSRILSTRDERYTPVARQRNPRDHTPPFPGSQSREVRDEGRGLSKEEKRATARQRSSEAEGLLFFGKYSVYNTHTHTWRGRGAPAGAKAAASESLHLLLRSLRTHLRRPRPSPRLLSSPRPRQARCRPSRRCRPSSPPSG